jgi:hypothetical protein
MFKASVFLLVASITFTSLVLSSGPALAKPTGVFRPSSCDSIHEACIGRCIDSGKEGSQLRLCTERCAGKWLHCNERERRG